MRLLKLALAACSLLLAAATASQQTPAAATLCDVRAAESAWNEANIRHDISALRKILSPEFVQITEDGVFVPREAALASLKSTAVTGAAYKVSHNALSVHGHVATVSAIYTEIGRGKGGYYRAVLRLADVYEYYGNRWRGIVGYAHLIAIKHCPEACRL